MAPEPETRRFIVLEHRGHGVHWDFLVEDGPTLRTWAVDEPIRPGVAIPARALPAHRRVYLDYEGPISGDRGAVMRSDRGEARADVWTEDEVRLEVQGDQLVGTVRLWVEDGSADADGEVRRWLFRWGKLS